MKREKIISWAKSLTEEQLREAVVNSVERLIEAEEVRFPDGTLSPYWESCGEPLVSGQPVWEDE